jgi:hypothetical protein
MEGQVRFQPFPFFPGLTRPGLEPTTYSTRVEHANHYATNAVTSGNKKQYSDGQKIQ